MRISHAHLNLPYPIFILLYPFHLESLVYFDGSLAYAMDIPRELIEQFVSITDAAETTASQLLVDSNCDLEAAITSFFAIQEAGGVPAPATAPVVGGGDVEMNPSTDGDAALAASLAAQDDADQVRAPIPQRIDTLLPNVAPRRSQAVADPFTASSGDANDSRIAELFRPPSHLVFGGTLDDAMALGAREKRWVIVTIHQGDVFACQVLNRDVWNDPAMKQLIETYFVFWQRDIESEDGAKYRQFYRFAEAPHIAILDPRSGERVASFSAPGDEFGAEHLIRYLTEFTTDNSLDSDDRVRLPASSSAARGNASAAGPTSAANSSAVPAAINIEDDIAGTEDAQLAAAIAASMESAGAEGMVVDMANGAPASSEAVHREVSRQLSASNPTLNTDRSLRAQQDSEYQASLAMDRAKEESKKEEELQANRKEEAREAKRRRVPAEPEVGAKGVTELVVRLPNNSRLKRRFLDSHTIGDVYDYVECAEEAAELTDFELMTPYPKKTFADRTMQIGAAGLSPRAMLIVHVP